MDALDDLDKIWHLPIWVYGLLAFLVYVSKVIPALTVLTKGGYRLFRKLRFRRRLRAADVGAWRQLKLTRLAEDQLERLRRIDHAEAWSDARFTELEAEVETNVQQHARLRLLKLPGQRRSGTGQQTRRERSLTKALMKTDEPIVFLHGNPGSGKSVALRRVARNLAERASKGVREGMPIPLYINLKHLEVGEEPVDPALIRNFVLTSLAEKATFESEDVLRKEFQPGLLSGRWLFLFDSFDEIPAVMASTELDDEVARYSGCTGRNSHHNGSAAAPRRSRSRSWRRGRRSVRIARRCSGAEWNLISFRFRPCGAFSMRSFGCGSPSTRIRTRTRRAIRNSNSFIAASRSTSQPRSCFGNRIASTSSDCCSTIVGERPL